MIFHLISVPDCVVLEHVPGVVVGVADGGVSLVCDGDDHEEGAHVAHRRQRPQHVREQSDVRPRGKTEVLPGWVMRKWSAI